MENQNVRDLVQTLASVSTAASAANPVYNGWSEPCPVEFVAKMVELLKGTELEQWMREAATIEVARRALREGLDVDTVAKITGLTWEKFLRLKEMWPEEDGAGPVEKSL